MLSSEGIENPYINTSYSSLSREVLRARFNGELLANVPGNERVSVGTLLYENTMKMFNTYLGAAQLIWSEQFLVE